ncbi:MAG: hypothetical protein CM1200mP2_07510 [Planctomycetaceae bacterium]|nr:MAG: hypothetical protein CM1200mP2_07510 [Planctomycetaceae bacterium]
MSKELDADEMLYVVDARQGEHFRLLFETARQGGYSDVEFAHVSFGPCLAMTVDRSRRVRATPWGWRACLRSRHPGTRDRRRER